MSRRADMEIAKRAAQCIRERAHLTDCDYSAAARKIGKTYQDLWNMENGYHVPNTAALQAMAFAGYDVIYILTGKRSEGYVRKTV